MKKKVTVIFFFLLSFSALDLPSLVLAQTPAPGQNIKSLGGIEGLGPLGAIYNLVRGGTVAPASEALASVLSTIIGVITIVAGIWFFFQILIGGFQWISSSGDKNKVQEVQHRITNSVIGLAVVVIAYALTSLFGKILGIPNILDLGAVIQTLGPK